MENKKICAICESRIEKEPVLMPALVYGDDYVYVCHTSDLKCVTAYRNQLEKSRAPGDPLSKLAATA